MHDARISSSWPAWLTITSELTRFTEELTLGMRDSSIRVIRPNEAGNLVDNRVLPRAREPQPVLLVTWLRIAE